MFTNRGGRKRGLSIYSILVLVLIFWGCGCERGALLTKSTRTDAGLLIEQTRVMGWCGEVIDGKRGGWYVGDSINSQPRYLDTYFVRLDDENLWNTFFSFTKFIELTPGNHTISAKFMRNSPILTDLFPIEPTIKYSINVEAHAVYVLLCMTEEGSGGELLESVTQTPWREFPIYSQLRKTYFTYGQTTGIATHPTDRKLSFKVK